MDSKTQKGEKKMNTFRVKAGLAQMLKGGGEFFLFKKFRGFFVVERFDDYLERFWRKHSLTHVQYVVKLTPHN